MATLRLLDVVALLDNLPTDGLSRGQVGTIVETLAPDVFEVEFSDRDGRAYALLALRAEQLLRLCYEPATSLADWLSRPAGTAAP